MDIETGLTSQDPEQLLTPVQQAVQQLLQSDTPKPASAALRPEFFVILADCTAPGAQHPAVLPPPDPKPKDTTDWGFFWLGLIFPLAWLLGCFCPLFRHPHFPQRQNLMGWIGNAIGTAALTAVAIVVIVLVARQGGS